MEQAGGGSHCRAGVEINQLGTRLALPGNQIDLFSMICQAKVVFSIAGGGEPVQLRLCSCRVQQSESADGAARPLELGAVPRRVDRPGRLPQDDERLLAVALPADDPHSQHIPLPRPEIRSAESRRRVSVGHGARHFQGLCLVVFSVLLLVDYIQQSLMSTASGDIYE